MMAPESEGGFVHHMEKVEGHKIRARNDSFKDYFTQAKLFYDSQSKPEKRHIVDAFHFELGKVKDKSIRQRMVYMIANVDRELATEVAKGIGVEPPTNEAKIKEVAKDAKPRQEEKKGVDKSPALSMENTSKDSIKGRKVAILIDEGFDYESVMKVKKKLAEGNASAEIISKFHDMIPASNGETLETDKNHVSTASVLYDAVFIAGGKKSVKAMENQGAVLHFVNEAYKHCKPIAAFGEAVEILRISALKDVEIETGDADGVISDMGVISTRKKDVLNEFADSFAESIAMHRFWEREEKDKATIPA